MGKPEDPVVEVRVDAVRDDGHALGDEGANAARVVEVVMRVDQVADRLGGDERLHLRDHGQGPLFTEGRLDKRHVIPELDSQAVRSNRRHQQPHALGHLHRLDAANRRNRPPGRLGDVDRARHIRLDVADGHVEHGEPALFLHNPSRKLHAGHVAVVRKAVLHEHVAEERLRHPRFHSFKKVLTVDVAVDLVFPLPGERDDGHAPAVHGPGRDGWRGGHRRFDEAVRRERQLKLTRLDRQRGRRRRAIRSNIPGDVSAQERRLRQLANKHRRAAALGRVQVGAHLLLA